MILINVEKNLKIKYQRGDKARYMWINHEVRTGTVIYIQRFVNIKDSITGIERSILCEDVVGYDTDN